MLGAAAAGAVAAAARAALPSRAFIRAAIRFRRGWNVPPILAGGGGQDTVPPMAAAFPWGTTGMPSIQNLVADLNNGSIVGVGASPSSDDENMFRAISAPHQVKYSFVHMKATISGTNKLTMASALSSIDFNGSYLHYDAAWSTIANMDVNRRIIVSGNFSGCMFKVFKVSPGVFKCAHISRPGQDSDRLVGLMDAYAASEGWTEVRAVPTVGLIGNNGCSGVICVSYLITNVRIETIRLEISAHGMIVGKTMWIDAV